MTALYYLGIIEGVAQARGEDAYPVKFWHALKMLAEELHAPSIMPPAKPIDLPEITLRGLEIMKQRAADAPLPLLLEPEADEEIQQTKKRAGWSAEALAAQAEWLRARHARNKSLAPTESDKVKEFLENGQMTKIRSGVAGGVF